MTEANENIVAGHTAPEKQTQQPDDGQPEAEQAIETGPAKPVSFMALGFYNFAFILLTLHGPYMFLYMLPNLVMTPQGLDYDMGGIFPHVGASIAVSGLQGFITFVITTIVCIARLFYRRLDAFVISFMSICGLQVLVYMHIYVSGNVSPSILQAFGPFSTSWVLLAIFLAASVAQIKFGRGRAPKAKSNHP